MAIALAILVRSAITRPLAALAAACRRITEGNFDEKITPHGPKDIRRIATDVEDMRQRIVADLAASQAAREQLDEQTVELRRSNAELEQFAYVASHDLQEPLRKVASFCQLLEKRYADQLDERGVEYIGFAVDGAKRMQVLINDLLTFSRVGRPSTTKDVDVDLDAALNAALGNLTTAIEESGAEIVRPDNAAHGHRGPDAADDAVAEPDRQRGQVSPRRCRAADRPRLRTRVRRARRRMAVRLEDNGIGIAEEFADKVFVIFQRLHGRDEYSGTGIGLALCKKIVEYHGGTIWIDTSYISDGTRIRFTLPAMQPSAVLEGSPE